MSQLISQREFAKRLGLSNSAVQKAIQQGKITKGLVKQGDKYLIDPYVAAAEWGKVLPATEEAKGLSDLASEATKAKHLQAVIKAQLEEMNLQQQRGALVSREKVYQSLFAYGQELSSALDTLPDRVIDAVRAAHTRHDALQILKDAIRTMLERITDITKRDIVQ